MAPYTRILPIPPEAWAPPTEEAVLEGRSFRPKRELHITLVGGRLGEALCRALGRAGAERAVETFVARFDWRFERLEDYRLLRRTRAGRGRPSPETTHSVIELVRLPAMAPFHAALGRCLGRQLPLPPPHVTLFTAGDERGIGVPSPRALRALTVRRLRGEELF